MDLVEGAIEIVCGPNQPKEGPLDSLVEHLASVTQEEPIHQNYDHDQHKPTKWKPKDG